MQPCVSPGEHITVEFLTLGQNKGISPGVVFMYSESPILSFTSVLRSSNYCKAYEMPHVTREGILYMASELTWTAGEANIYQGRSNHYGLYGQSRTGFWPVHKLLIKIISQFIVTWVAAGTSDVETLKPQSWAMRQIRSAVEKLNPASLNDFVSLNEHRLEVFGKL